MAFRSLCSPESEYCNVEMAVGILFPVLCVLLASMIALVLRNDEAKKPTVEIGDLASLKLAIREISAIIFDASACFGVLLVIYFIF